MSAQWTIGLTRQDLTEIRLNEAIDGLPSGLKAVIDIMIYRGESRAIVLDAVGRMIERQRGGHDSYTDSIMDDNRWTALALAVEAYLERMER